MSDMRLMLLGCAAAALTITAPALARDSGGGGWHNGGGHGGSHHGHHQRLERLDVFASADDMGRHRHASDGFVGGYGYGYGMEDRTFEPDSYNDWWHDNPARAYPRWGQDNKDCAPERMWWHGDTLRC